MNAINPKYHSKPCYHLLIAECLSLRLLILQRVFSVGGVWCHASGRQFVTLQECNLSLGMQLKVWLVHKHPSHLGMQLKYLVYKSCVHLRKFIVLIAVAASRCDNKMAKIVMGARRSRSLARKRKRRQRA